MNCIRGSEQGLFITVSGAEEKKSIYIGIDGKIIRPKVPVTSLAKATVLIFQAFYLFSINYPEESANTLDFIQRYF